MNTINEDKARQLLRNVRGGYLGIAWKVVEEDGTIVPDNALRPGTWIVAENYYGYVFLRVADDYTLVEHTMQEEE